MNEPVTEVDCPPDLHQLWRTEDTTLPAQWREQYPQLFDDDDLRLAQGPQRRNHFCEWFAAIHLFQRDGARSLVEKYDTFENHRLNHLRKGHRRKVADYEKVVPEDKRQVLHEIGSRFRVQLPDLLVLSGDGRSFSFAEVKGPTDHTLKRENQWGSRCAIRTQLGVSVEVIKINLVPPSSRG